MKESFSGALIPMGLHEIVNHVHIRCSLKILNGGEEIDIIRTADYSVNETTEEEKSA